MYHERSFTPPSMRGVGLYRSFGSGEMMTTALRDVSIDLAGVKVDAHVAQSGRHHLAGAEAAIEANASHGRRGEGSFVIHAGSLPLQNSHPRKVSIFGIDGWVFLNSRIRPS